MTGYPVIFNGDHAEFEREHANTPPHERPDWPLPSFNAWDWAKAFLKAYESYRGDDFLAEDNMQGWFANALMRGFDERASRDAAEIKGLSDELDNVRERRRKLQAALILARRSMIVSVTGISDGLTIHDIRQWIEQADAALDPHKPEERTK